MMLEELSLVLDRVPQIARKGEYNGQSSGAECTWQAYPNNATEVAQKIDRTLCAGSRCSVFRFHRIYRRVDPAGRPMLAFLTAVARDPLLRAKTPFVLRVPIGEVVGALEIGSHLGETYPGRFQGV